MGKQAARDVIRRNRHLGFMSVWQERVVVRKIASFVVNWSIHEEKYDNMPKEDRKEYFKILGIENSSSESMSSRAF